MYRPVCTAHGLICRSMSPYDLVVGEPVEPVEAAHCLDGTVHADEQAETLFWQLPSAGLACRSGERCRPMIGVERCGRIQAVVSASALRTSFL